MSEITVIKTADTNRILSKEEREVLYQQIAEQLRIPGYYFDEITKLEDEAVATELRETIPDIPALLVRRLIDFNNVIPIIRSLRNNLLTIDDIHREWYGIKRITGGVFFKKLAKAQQAKFRPTDTHHVTIQILKPQRVVCLPDLEKFLNSGSNLYQINANESIDVIGLIICQEQIPDPDLFGIPARLRSGMWTYDMLWHTLFSSCDMMNGRIQANLTELRIGGKKIEAVNTAGKTLYTMFGTNMDALCTIMLELLIYLSKYRLGNYIDEFISIARSGPGTGLLQQIHQILTTEPVIESVVAIKSPKREDPVYQYVEKLRLFGVFSKRYTDSVWYDLTAYGYMTLFEKIYFTEQSIPADQMKQYKADITKLLNARRTEMETRAYNTRKRRTEFADNLEEMQYRYIYIKKFGYERFRSKSGVRILDCISPEERSIVQTEHKNQQKIDEMFAEVSAANPPFIQIVREIRRSTSHQDKFRLLQELRNHITIPDLTADTGAEGVRGPEEQNQPAEQNSQPAKRNSQPAKQDREPEEGEVLEPEEVSGETTELAASDDDDMESKTGSWDSPVGPKLRKKLLQVSVNIVETAFKSLAHMRRFIENLNESMVKKLKRTFPDGDLAKAIFNASSGVKRSTKSMLTKYMKYWMNRGMRGGDESGMRDYIRTPDGYPVICPHVVELIELEYKRVNPSDIRTRILKYAGKTPLYHTYYCGICGEMIAHSERLDTINMFEGNQPTMYHDLDEALKDYIWKLTNQVVRNYIQFQELQTNRYINTFVSNITAGLYDLINLIEKKLLKSKTSSIEETEYKKRLYTVIYIYAMLIKVILDNPEAITFATLGWKMQMPKLVAYALDKISTTQNVIINKLSDVNDTFLETSIVKALQNVTLVVTKTRLEKPPELDITAQLGNDPVYRYISYMTLVADLRDVDDMAKVLRISREASKLVKLYGFDTTDQLESAMKAGAYSNIRIPKFTPEYPGSFRLLQEPAKFAALDISPAYVFDDYFAEVFRIFCEYVKSGCFAEYLYDVTIVEDTSGIHHITTGVSPAYKGFADKLRPIRECERIYIDLKRHSIVPGFYNIPVKNNLAFSARQYNQVTSSLLSRKYGEAAKANAKPGFHKHKWDLYVYVAMQDYYPDKRYDEYKSTVVIPAKDLSGRLNDPEFQNLKLIDVLCSKCLYSVRTSGDIKDPLDSLERDRLITNFYNFYENRCPQPTSKNILTFFHDFANEKCRNCGFDKQMLYDKDPVFFKKYEPSFRKDLARVSASVSRYRPEYEPDTKIDKSIVTWVHNPNIVNEFATKTYDMMRSNKMKKTEYYNVLINIGLLEKFEYDAIMSGAEMPHKAMDDATALTRIYRLDLYIKEVIFDYMTLVNADHMATIPGDLKFVDDKDQKAVSELPSIGEAYRDYFSLIQQVRRSRSPVEVSQYLLEYFFQMLLTLLKYLERVSKKFANDFVVHCINKFMNTEKTTCKLKDYKNALIEATQRVDTNEANLQDHSESRVYDDLVKGKKSDFEYDFDYESESLDTGGHSSEF